MELAPEKVLVFDADVIIHFMQGGKFEDLQNIFPNNQKVILEKVLTELQVYKSSENAMDIAINDWKLFTVAPFPISPEMMKEYAHLTSSLMNMGKGESACMSYCKLTENIVVSSNLRDVGEYCKRHNVGLLTTFDLIHEAFTSKLWTEEDCDAFISVVRKKGGRLPFGSLKESLK